MVKFFEGASAISLEDRVQDASATPRRSCSCSKYNRSIVKNHVPQFLDRLAETLESDDLPKRALETAIAEHAKDRYELGYDVREVVSEYQVLRRTILDVYAEQESSAPSQYRPTISPLIVFNELIDLAIGSSVDAFMLHRDRARDIFVGILGHDLRGPLQSVLAGAEILASATRGIDGAMTTKLGVRMRTSCARMVKLVDGLLDFARTHFGGGIPIDPQPTDLRALVSDVVDELASAHPDRRIECRAAVAPGDFGGEFDTTRVAQAITNLVGNAVEHGADPIVVEPVDEGPTVRIDVKSSGLIAPELVPRLFKPFVHLAHGDRGVRRGLGLGLFIVSEIARAHQGEAFAANHDDGRTCFSLRLKRSLRNENK